MDKLSYIGIKNYYSSKNSIKEKKRQVTELEKIHALMYLTKGLHAKKVKNSYKSITKEVNSTRENG